jgi:hypothetical protein
MCAASSPIDMGKSIESVDTWNSVRDSDNPGSYTHSSASIESLSVTDGDGLRDLWDDCGIKADGLEDEFLDLLDTDKLCPPALKQSKGESGLQNLVDYMHTVYENYLASKEYEARTVNLTVSQQFQRWREIRVSFACIGDNDGLISVLFVIDTSEIQTHEPLSREDHMDMHREFDVDFTDGDIDKEHGSLTKTLMTLRKASRTIVTTCQTASGDAAWWRAFKRSNGRGGDDGLYQFYGVIHPSADPTRRDGPTACGNSLDNDDEEEYDMITELNGKELGED